MRVARRSHVEPDENALHRRPDVIEAEVVELIDRVLIRHRAACATFTPTALTPV